MRLLCTLLEMFIFIAFICYMCIMFQKNYSSIILSMNLFLRFKRDSILSKDGLYLDITQIWKNINKHVKHHTKALETISPLGIILALI